MHNITVKKCITYLSLGILIKLKKSGLRTTCMHDKPKSSTVTPMHHCSVLTEYIYAILILCMVINRPGFYHACRSYLYCFFPS